MVYAVVFTPVMQGIDLGYCFVHAQCKSIIINKRDRLNEESILFLDGTFRLEMPNASYSTKITLLELEMETNVEYKNLTNGGVELIFILRPQYTPWTIEMSHVT